MQLDQLFEQLAGHLPDLNICEVHADVLQVVKVMATFNLRYSLHDVHSIGRVVNRLKRHLIVIQVAQLIDLFLHLG